MTQTKSQQARILHLAISLTSSAYRLLSRRRLVCSSGMVSRLLFQLSRRTFVILLLTFIIWNSLETFLVRRNLSSSPFSSTPSHELHNQKIFVATTFGSHWNRTIEALVTSLGPENFHVSIDSGSGSWNHTEDALNLLDQHLGMLGVSKTIILNDTTHVHEIAKPSAWPGWIDTPRGEKESRRIPYVSRLRNLSLKPLEELAKSGSTFDKILFLDDVVFTVWSALSFILRTSPVPMCSLLEQPRDVLNLLYTNDGDYAAACALDFAKPPRYYNGFALRDSNGDEPMMQVWPYFRSWQSRAALKASKPVPVWSCWSGMGEYELFNVTPSP